jgi:hypothetical protein
VVGFDSTTKNLVLADGEHAIIRGTLTAVGISLVDSAGADLLVVYDKEDGSDDSIFQGAVALLGFAEAGNVLIA